MPANAPLVAVSGSSTHGDAKAMRDQEPAERPDRTDDAERRRRLLGRPAEGGRRAQGVRGVARSASVRQIAGIILYVDPLPMPVAAKMHRKNPRNHGNHDWFGGRDRGSAVGFGVSWRTRPQHREREHDHRARTRPA